MNENIKTACICNTGYDKGAFKKTIENNIFTIFGNISKNSTIVLRYHGELIDNICYENYENNLYIKYFFDDDRNTLNKINLAKCTKCIGENYCVLLELGNHNKITFSFCTTQDLEKEDLMSFNLNISEDLLSTFVNKYEDSQSTNLPVLENRNERKLKIFLRTIKDYFYGLKAKITST